MRFASRRPGFVPTAQARAERALRAWVAGAEDRRLDRVVGSDAGLRLLFGAMAARFVPEAAQGFEGELGYELRTSAGTVRAWTVRVGPASATAVRGRPDHAALTVRASVADFARLGAGVLDPGRALLGGQLDVEGDFALALRLGEMFGRPS